MLAAFALPTTPTASLYPLSAVRLLSGPFTEVAEANQKYMLALWRKFASGDVGVVRKAWMPRYNLHKSFAGLRGAYLVAGVPKAREILVP